MHSYKRIYIISSKYCIFLYIFSSKYCIFKSIGIGGIKKERQSLTSLTLNIVKNIPLLEISRMSSFLAFSVRNVSSRYHSV